MKNILKNDCLVLNKSWVPCGMSSVRRAIGMAIKSRGKIVHPVTLSPYTFDEWIEKGHERDADEILDFKNKTYDMPTIICAIHYDDLHVKYMPLSHQSIYRRDNFKCVYCGSKNNLTWDHVVPECEKGKTSWTNLVTCCKKCNNEKDRMSVEEFCQIMNCEIPKPVSLAGTPWLLGKAKLRPEWRFFLKGG